MALINLIIFLIVPLLIFAENSSTPTSNPPANAMECEKVKNDSKKCARDYVTSITRILPNATTVICNTAENTSTYLNDSIIRAQSKCTEGANVLTLHHKDIFSKFGAFIMKRNNDSFEALKQNSFLCSTNINEILKCVDADIQYNTSYPLESFAKLTVKCTEMFFSGRNSSILNGAVKCLQKYRNERSTPLNDCNTTEIKYIDLINKVFTLMKCLINTTELKTTLIQCHKEAIQGKFGKCSNFDDFKQKLISYARDRFGLKNREKHEKQIDYYIQLLNLTMPSPMECEKHKKNYTDTVENCMKNNIGEAPPEFSPDDIFEMNLDENLNMCFNYNNSLTCILKELKNIQDPNCREEYMRSQNTYHHFLMDSGDCSARIKQNALPINSLSSSSLTPGHIALITVVVIVVGGLVSSVIYCKNKIWPKKQEEMEMR